MANETSVVSKVDRHVLPDSNYSLEEYVSVAKKVFKILSQYMLEDVSDPPAKNYSVDLLKNSLPQKQIMAFFTQMFSEKLLDYKTDPLFSQTILSQRQIEKRFNYLAESLLITFVREGREPLSFRGQFDGPENYSLYGDDPHQVNINLPSDFESNSVSQKEFYEVFRHELRHALQWVFGVLNHNLEDQFEYRKYLLEEIFLITWPSVLSLLLSLGSQNFAENSQAVNSILTLLSLANLTERSRMISKRPGFYRQTGFASLHKKMKFYSKNIEIDARNFEKKDQAAESIGQRLKKAVQNMLRGERLF